jgi:uncharacterized membrane protein YdjX (TVP38/TMEM64 family)
MKSLLAFLSRMDASAVRTAAVSVALFVMVAAIFVIGRFVLGVGAEDVQGGFDRAAADGYALPLTIIAFIVLSFLGAPQFGLIAAAVLAFGPVTGFWHAWIGTMAAATVNFYAGRLMGADFVRRYGGDTVNRISDFVGRNGFWASLVIRIVPSAPFVVVNAAAGVSAMSILAFLGGTAIGIVPKTALVAFASEGVMQLATQGDLVMAGLLALGALCSLGAILAARAWFRRPGMDAAPAPADEPVSGAGRLAIEDAPSHKE